MTNSQGREFVFHGRFWQLSRQAAGDAVVHLGGRVCRGLTRRTSFLVIGWGAVEQIRTGQLEAKLVRADRLRARSVSEREFLLITGLAERRPIANGMSTAELQATSGLTTGVVRLLSLFDVIEPQDGRHDLRDLIVCREVARLVAEGTDLADVIAARVQLRKRDPQGLSRARLNLARRPDGSIALRAGDILADLDGQFRLPLPDALNSTLDDIFETAEAAEAAGELELAEVSYRRCVDLDGRDPISLFNLANVLRERGKVSEAELYLRRAVSFDPQFAEAWYNLSSLMEEKGQRALAKEYLGAALSAELGYGDALYNLAHLHFVDGRYAEARQLWKRYWEIDPDSEWGQNAHRGVMACAQLEKETTRPVRRA